MIAPLWQNAIQRLGFRQQAYQRVFDGAMQTALIDLARYSRAFDADTSGMSDRDLWEMHGRRQMFFRIVSHLKLTSQELEQVYRPELVMTANRLQQRQGHND